MEKLLNVENDWDGEMDCPEVIGPRCLISEEEVAAAIKGSHVIRLLKKNIYIYKLLFISVKNIVYFHSMYGIILISPDNHNYIQFCEA